MTIRKLSAIVLIAVAATWATASDESADPDKPRIDSLESTLSGERVEVSFRLLGGLDEEALERIHSGIPLTFRHRLDVVAKRAMPLMPAKVVARTQVETTVEYDTLTRRYHLLRRIEHKSERKKLAPPIDEVRELTSSLDEVRSWMTALSAVQVYDPARTFPDKVLRIRVRSSVARRYVMWIIPTTVSASAEQKIEP